MAEAEGVGGEVELGVGVGGRGGGYAHGLTACGLGWGGLVFWGGLVWFEGVFLIRFGGSV